MAEQTDPTEGRITTELRDGLLRIPDHRDRDFRTNVTDVSV